MTAPFGDAAASPSKLGVPPVPALSQCRIVELAETPSGEYCGKLLSDFGAEVIKIEIPGSGSPTRSLGPLASSGGHPERSGLFAYLNTNKKSVALDLSTASGTATLSLLLDQADAVIDDHPPGWLKGVGLDPGTLEAGRPGLVLCSITDFGQEPLDDRRHAEDLTVFHGSGWGYHTPGGGDDTQPPLNGPGRFLPSYEAGLEAALCVAAALYDRASSQTGRFIDISKQAVLASRLDYVLGQLVAGDMDVSPRRGVFDLRGPAGIFACRDGYVYVWLSEPVHWQALGRLLGGPDWMRPFPDRWLERECTAERVAECRRGIAAWLKDQARDKVVEDAQRLGLTLAPLNAPDDLLMSPQYLFRAYFAEVTHPVLGTAMYPTVPYRMSASPARIDAPAPLLGQHTEAGFAALSGNNREDRP
jgi:crotonobetainyl-CoA:carnitine CoA-transferase CaiB-like acyl-CoA transferase